MFVHANFVTCSASRAIQCMSTKLVSPYLCLLPQALGLRHEELNAGLSYRHRRIHTPQWESSRSIVNPNLGNWGPPLPHEKGKSESITCIWGFCDLDDATTPRSQQMRPSTSPWLPPLLSSHNRQRQVGIPRLW
jgi:hypothetical protein